MGDNFYEIKQAYKDSNISEIQKRVFGFKYLVFTVAFIMGIISTSLIIISNTTMTIGGLGLTIIIYGVYLFMIFQREKKFFLNHFDVKDDFLKNNRKNRVGQRALLFFEKIYSMNYNMEEFIKRLDIEIEHQKYSIWENPYVIGSFAILGMLFQALISLEENKHLLAPLMGIAIILCLLIANYFEAFRTEEAKMKELKLFLYWYDLFGKAMVKNKKLVS